jgi:hypothetical protein
MLIEAYGTRLLRDQLTLEDPAGACDEEAPDRPAESECLQQESTVMMNKSFINSLQSFRCER